METQLEFEKALITAASLTPDFSRGGIRFLREAGTQIRHKVRRRMTLKIKKGIEMNYNSMKKRKSVSYSKDLEFPIDKVWSVISAPQNLENCHPFY